MALAGLLVGCKEISATTQQYPGRNSSAMPPVQPKRRDEFAVAIVCALPLEYDAVCHTFDVFWDDEGDQYGRADRDPNTYTTGAIANHNVVLVLLPATGNLRSASVASSLRSSYSNVRLTLLVGICGGVPCYESSEVFLGDVVISNMILHTDFGRQFPDKFVRKESARDSRGQPSRDVRSVLAILQTERGQDRLQERAVCFLQQLQIKVAGTKNPRKYVYPGAQKDELLAPSRRHKHYTLPKCVCQHCVSSSDPVCHEALKMLCADLGCNDGSVLNLARTRSQSGLTDSAPQPQIHVGIVASSDKVMKSAEHRDNIHKETGAIAFEMEGAGVSDEGSCIVIKGVCDYADCHKHKGWQMYAAATAAAVSKALLERYTSTKETVTKQERGDEVDRSVFRAPISGHNVVAGITTTSGGTVNINFRS